jgi:hypothetical protein
MTDTAAGGSLATPYLDLETIDRVVRMPDPLARNAAITRGYHALSEAVAALIGRRHANWLTYGQWASAEARRSISGEAVPAAVRRFVGAEVAEAVAAGNATIFEDVAPPFVRFVRAFAGNRGAGARGVGVGADADAVRALLGDLLADPQVAASADLTRAFGAYVDAMLMGGDDTATGDEAAAAVEHRRAQRILVANVSIGAHEQLVADPFVRAAIPGRWIVAIAATSHLGIRIPEGTLELSRDVPPPPYLHGALFPPELIHLDDPEAVALAARFGQDAESASGSDAPDWESYRERMGFIFTLLRAHQRDPSLFDLPPGTPEG